MLASLLPAVRTREGREVSHAASEHPGGETGGQCHNHDHARPGDMLKLAQVLL